MNSQQILAAIEADVNLHPLRLARNDAAIAEALSVGRTKVVSNFFKARGIAAAYPGGPLESEVIMIKLETAATSMLASTDPAQNVLGSLLNRQLGFLKGEGLDFGDPTLRGMLDQFEVEGVLTSQEVTNLKSLALAPDPIHVNDVSIALNTISTVAGV